MNSCYLFITTINTNQVILANYSHLVPIVLSIFLAIFVMIKAKFNLFSKIFFAFVATFSVWLIGDLILWTFYNYDLIYASWAPLDLIEIIFYIFGLYFVLVFDNKKDISPFKKVLLILLIIPALYLTITKQSVLGFDQSMCEAISSNFLTTYKLVIESILLLIMFFVMLLPFIRRDATSKKKANLIVIGSMFLLLSIFGVTEYIAATTGVYEINLYSLFLLPIFLTVIIYAVFELDIFNFHVLGTQYLVIGLIILMSGQLFFVNGTTDELLTVITLILSIALSYLLYRNLKKETDQRLHIEKLSFELEETNNKLAAANEKLKEVDKLKTEFLSLASHQLRSPLTAIKGYASMIIEGDYGELNNEAKDAVDRIFQSSKSLTIIVDDLLNIAKIEQGGMKYEMAPFCLNEIVEMAVKDFSINAEKKGLKMDAVYDENDKCIVDGDKEKLRQVIVNLIDNSIKYTKEGEIHISVKRNPDTILFSVEDTGMGMTKEIKDSLFDKFARGDGSKMNTSGSGLGLYLAKQITMAHHGHIYVESKGPNKGSTFTVELYPAKEIPKEPEAK